MPGAMIFAAGFGTRMGALTRRRPKPLIPVGGRTLLARSLDLARAAGAAPIVVNAHYLAEQIVEAARAEDVTVRVELPRILDTGGGLKAALHHFPSGPILALNADAVFTGPNPLADLLAAWQPGRMGALLSLVPQTRATGRRGGGDFALDADARLSRDKGGLVYTGAQIVDPAVIAAEPEAVFSFNRVWDRLIGEGRAFGRLHAGGWADVGHPDGIALAEALL